MKPTESSIVALREVLERDGILQPKPKKKPTISTGYFVVLFISTVIGVVAGRLLNQLF